MLSAVTISLLSGNLLAIPITLSPSESAAIDFHFSAPPAVGVDYLWLNLGSISSSGGASIQLQSDIYNGTSLLGTYTGIFSSTYAAQWTTSSSYFAPYLPAINFASIQNGSIAGKMTIQNTSTSGDVQFDSSNVKVQVAEAIGPFVTYTNPTKQPVITSVVEQSAPPPPNCVAPQVLQGNACVTPTPPPPAPTVASKIFGLVVGLFSPGTTEQPGKVDGATDASNVYQALKSGASGQWASAAQGNTLSSVSLTLQSTDGKQKIQDSLNAMKVSPGDTVIFYYSGHGQSFASVGGKGETPVNILNGYGANDGDPTTNAWKNNTSDETIQLGALYDGVAAHSDRYLSDDELAAMFLNDPKWVGVRKVFIVDACYGGGFWQTGVSNDFGDLNRLDNVHFLAAAPETMRARTVTDGSGLGLWTEKAFLPALKDLGLNSTWADLQTEIDRNIADWNAQSSRDIFGVSYAKDGVYDPIVGFEPLTGFNANSPDFDMKSTVFSASVPEPTTLVLLLFALGLMALQTERSRQVKS